MIHYRQTQNETSLWKRKKDATTTATTKAFAGASLTIVSLSRTKKRLTVSANVSTDMRSQFLKLVNILTEMIQRLNIITTFALLMEVEHLQADIEVVLRQH